MKVAKLVGKLREQIAGFSGELSKGLGKVSRRFVEEMLYGIQTRSSVKLSEVGRSLQEPIPLKKTIERLSRQLGRKELGDHVRRRIVGRGAARIADDTLLILDPSDLCKPYAEHMEYLAEIRDGSEKILGKGYWLLHVVGAQAGEEEITPLYQSLWSQDAPGFMSENTEILRAVEEVSAATEKRGIWMIDRGGDRKKLIVPFLNRRLRFLIRMVGNRDVMFRGRKRLVREVAAGCPLPYADTIIKEVKGKERRYDLQYGFRKVSWPGREEPLYLLVVTGFGQEPLMLLTNVPLRKKRSVLWWGVEAYLTRWRIEETIRFIKQSYALEDIRVLTYVRLQNMMALVLAAAYFAAVYLGRRVKLEILAHHVLKAARRIFGIPDFRYYALADGIREILGRAAKGPLRYLGVSPPTTGQLTFDLGL